MVGRGEGKMGRGKKKNPCFAIPVISPRGSLQVPLLAGRPRPFSLVNRSSAKNDPRFTCEKRQGGNTCGHILFLPVGREGCSCDSLAALSGIEGRDPCIKKNSCLCFAFPSAPPVCVICHSWLCMRFLSLPLSFSLVALP